MPKKKKKDEAVQDIYLFSLWCLRGWPGIPGPLVLVQSRSDRTIESRHGGADREIHQAFRELEPGDSGWILEMMYLYSVRVLSMSAEYSVLLRTTYLDVRWQSGGHTIPLFLLQIMAAAPSLVVIYSSMILSLCVMSVQFHSAPTTSQIPVISVRIHSLPAASTALGLQ